MFILIFKVCSKSNYRLNFSMIPHHFVLMCLLLAMNHGQLQNYQYQAKKCAQQIQAKQQLKITCALKKVVRQFLSHTGILEQWELVSQKNYLQVFFFSQPTSFKGLTKSQSFFKPMILPKNKRTNLGLPFQSCFIPRLL